MTLNRWKVLACTLTVGVGGLAVFATPPAADKSDTPKEPAPLPNLTVKPDSPANGTETPPAVAAAKTQDFDIVLPEPEVTPPARPEETTQAPTFAAASDPVAPSAPVVPASAESNSPPVAEETKSPATETPTVIVPPAPVKPEPAKPNVPLLELPKVESPKPTVGDVKPPAAPAKPEVTITPTAPMLPADKTFAPSPVPQIGPAPEPTKLPLVSATKTGAQPAKLKMLLRMGDGQPRFEIRNSASTELLLKVYGENIEMQAPPEARSSLAGVTAMGRVRFIAPGIEGTCDHLSILSGTGEVLLKGNIHLKSKRGKAWSEMTAEKMVYQIGPAGMASPVARNPVTPASYIPD